MPRSWKHNGGLVASLLPVQGFNSLWPSDAIWWHRSGSTLAQVMACWHQAITWTNVDLSSVRSSDIHLRAISQETTQPSTFNICLKITYLRLQSNLPGANELTRWTLWIIFKMQCSDINKIKSISQRMNCSVESYVDTVSCIGLGPCGNKPLPTKP